MPNCLEKIEKAYRHYRQTPYDCHQKKEETLELQEYYNNIVCTTAGNTVQRSSPKYHSINVTYEHHVSDKNGQNNSRGKEYCNLKLFDISVFSTT